MTQINDIEPSAEQDHVCPGCDTSMNLPHIRKGLSRYGHGNICSNCCTQEAFAKDFITNKKILTTDI